jgi:hypothetical protein
MPIFQETLSHPHPKLLEVLGRIDSENIKTRDKFQSTRNFSVPVPYTSLVSPRQEQNSNGHVDSRLEKLSTAANFLLINPH